jgi:putative two-component system hydrogenase maturation factor HypX/HoxX
VRILLLVSAFNGLSQRVWCALREAEHEVGVLLAGSAQDIVDGVHAADPELILCPFLKERVPAEVWQNRRTIVLHPGPVGDRGPSSLDWAISESAPVWGVTALQAVEELDAGPVWATRTFPMPAAAPRKSALYTGPVADAAMECVAEVVTKAADPSFVPIPADRAQTGTPAEVPGARSRPSMSQADRRFDWSEPAETILRRIRAADGAPGVRTELAGLEVYAYDAHPGTARGRRPGMILSRRQGAVLVSTGGGSLWIGHLRAAAEGGIKLPATTALGARLHGVPHSEAGPVDDPDNPYAYRQVRYRRDGAVGWLHFDFYNGAMAPGHSRRLLAGLRHAVAQDTRVLVLRGGTEAFSNGIHLNVIEGSADPSGAAWAAIRAINEVCREIITCTRQVVIAAYAGSAGAGGVMLGLGADIIAARDGIVLNPYYDMGLFGSELHTFTLPRRVGQETAQRLIDDRLPVSVAGAARIGLVDEIGPRHPEAYGQWLSALAEQHSDLRAARKRRAAKARRLAAERIPLDVYETRELAEMSRDIYTDRSGFAGARRAFVRKLHPSGTPKQLLFAANSGPVSGVPGAGGRQRNTGPAVDRRPALRPAVPVSA